MILLKILGTLIRVIRDGATPGQIAGGFTLGFAIGFIPGWPLQVLVLLLVLLLLNVNLAIGIASALLAATFSYLFDGLLDSIGGNVLAIEGLKGLYTILFNSHFWMLTRFNNTVVMGAGVVWLVAAIPMFILLYIGVVQYRKRLEPWVLKLKVVRMIQGSRAYDFYSRISQFRIW